MVTRASLSQRSLIPSQRSQNRSPRPHRRLRLRLRLRLRRHLPRRQRPQRSRHPLHRILLPTHHSTASVREMVVSYNCNVRQIWMIHGANLVPLGCRVTSYIIKQMTPAKETTVLMTCDHKSYPQACAGYYSAIHAGSLPDKFVCTESHHDGRLNGQATKDWSDQHKNGKWKSFTRAFITDNKGQEKAPKCERDEYPVSRQAARKS